MQEQEQEQAEQFSPPHGLIVEWREWTLALLPAFMFTFGINPIVTALDPPVIVALLASVFAVLYAWDPIRSMPGSYGRFKARRILRHMSGDHLFRMYTVPVTAGLAELIRREVDRRRDNGDSVPLRLADIVRMDAAAQRGFFGLFRRPPR